jgi:imidazolonepropionase-like amidohydrolase
VKRTGDAIEVLIEMDCDGHRSGVGPADKERLLAIAAELKRGGALLVGVLTHAGESYSAQSKSELEAAAEIERKVAVDAAVILRSAGFDCTIVSVGSTPTAHFAKDLKGVTEKNISAGFYNTAREQVKLASEIGVPIMTGTDVTDSYVFPGFSMHTELEDLSKSGMSNLKALQSATIIPAEFAKMEKSYGTVENGKIADLIILDKNPLENITNSKTIFGVILNGLYYDTDKIEELQNYTQSMASSFHVNVKILYSFIASPLIRQQIFVD